MATMMITRRLLNVNVYTYIASVVLCNWISAPFSSHIRGEL